MKGNTLLGKLFCILELGVSANSITSTVVIYLEWLLTGVSENTFSLTLDRTDTLTTSMQILYLPGAELKSNGKFSGRVPQRVVWCFSETLQLPTVILCRLLSVWIQETRSQCFPAVLRHF